MTTFMKQALAIGNDAYAAGNHMITCVNDATDMSKCLQSIGFQVDTRVNLDYDAMQIVTQRFVRSIQPGSVVLFYFSGHGIQYDGYNFLIPIGDESLSTANIKNYALSAERLVQDMHMRGPRAVIVILDSCRAYWGPGSLLRPLITDGARPQIKSGLAPMRVPPATIVAYACAAEASSYANSVNGRNSIYTGHLVRFITTPNVDIDQVLRVVGGEVQKETQDGQIPYRYSSCNEPICLASNVGMNVSPWQGFMQPNANFMQVKALQHQQYMNWYLQQQNGIYPNRFQSQHYTPRHHHSNYMHRPSKMMRYHTFYGYPSTQRFYWRQ